MGLIKRIEQTNNLYQTWVEITPTHAEVLWLDHEMTEAEAEEFEMLALLVKNYEDKHYKIDTSEVTPLDIIKFRMEQNGLTAKDMTAYLGSPSKVSEVLSGKRPLSLTMIKKLHKGLHISADLLLEV